MNLMVKIGKERFNNAMATNILARQFRIPLSDYYSVDFSCWEIGRNWCRPSNPDGKSCILDKECKKII